MQCQAINGAEVAVILANDLVLLEVPALDLAVLAGGKEVRMAIGDFQCANGVDVAGQCQLELSLR